MYKGILGKSLYSPGINLSNGCLLQGNKSKGRIIKLWPVSYVTQYDVQKDVRIYFIRRIQTNIVVDWSSLKCLVSFQTTNLTRTNYFHDQQSQIAQITEITGSETKVNIIFYAFNTIGRSRETKTRYSCCIHLTMHWKKN